MSDFVVCFVCMSFSLIHFHLRLFYQLYIGIVKLHVFDHTKSAVAVVTCQVQVSAADTETVQTIATEILKPPRCRLTLTFTLTSIVWICRYISLYVILLAVIQLCSADCSHLEFNYRRTRCRHSQQKFVLSSLLTKPNIIDERYYLEYTYHNSQKYPIEWNAYRRPNFKWMNDKWQ